MKPLNAKPYWMRPAMVLGTIATLTALAGCQTVPKHGLTPLQIATLKQQGFVDTDQGWTLDQSATVFFSVNDATLSAAGAQSIDKVARALKNVDLTHLKVVGYTDATGSDAYNDDLSKRRADAVANEYVNQGFAPGGLQAIGMGKRDPIADNRTAEGRAQNRHVAIIVVAD